MALRLERIPVWDEVKRLWEEILNRYRSRTVAVGDVVFMGLVFFTGARISEILSIRKGDINLNRGVVVIRQLKKRGEVRREVLLPDFLIEYIREYISGLGEEDRLFKMARNTAYMKVKKFTGYNPHAFRHTFAIEILKRTNNLEYARRLLGHANYNTLKHYLNFTVEDIRDKIEGMF